MSLTGIINLRAATAMVVCQLKFVLAILLATVSASSHHAKTDQAAKLVKVMKIGQRAKQKLTDSGTDAAVAEATQAGETMPLTILHIDLSTISVRRDSSSNCKPRW